MNKELNIDQLLKEAEMMEAYISITAEMGPSEQLLAFINYDKSLESEIGLEGFDGMSLLARHEILRSKMKPESVRKMALEGLIDNIRTLFKRNKDRVEEIQEEREDPSNIGRLPIADIVSHGVSPRDGSSDRKGIDHYVFFAQCIGGMEFNFKIAEAYLSNIPNDFKEESWVAYKKFVDGKIEDMWDKYEDLSVELANSHMREGGSNVLSNTEWSPSRFKEAVKSYQGIIDKQENLILGISKELEGIVSWLEAHGSDPENKNILPTIQRVVSMCSKSDREVDHMANQCREILRDASVLFDISE